MRTPASRIALALVLAACGTFAFAVDGAAPTGALVVDMRESSPRAPPPLADDEKRKLFAEIGAGEGTTVNGVVRGAFTAPGRDETVYIVQHGGPRAADPAAPEGVELLIFRDGHLIQRLDTDAGNAVEAVLRTRGVDELLLRTDTYQMGIATTRLDLVSLAGARVSVLASIPEARIDRCDDARFGGDVEALVIRIRHPDPRSKPEVETERFSAACEDGQAPRSEKFLKSRG